MRKVVGLLAGAGHVADLIGFHARRRPGQVAVIANGAPVTYAALDRELRAMTAALAGLGLAPSSLAAISHDDLYIHLLILLGCLGLGIASGSFHPNEGAECYALLADADIVITSRQHAPPSCRRLFTVSEDWARAVLAAPAPMPPDYPPAARTDIVAIFRSSGTTGQPKRMAITRANLDARLRLQRNQAEGLGLHRHARFLATMHFSVGSMVMSVLNCLSLGATFMFATGRNAAEVLRDYRPTHLTMMPYQLRLLLADLPEAGPLLPGLTVQSIGAKIPDDLRRLISRKLAGRVREIYGTNEVGAAGLVDESGIVSLTKGIEVGIAGPHGEDLAIGEIGALRIRGETVVDGYVGDPVATAEMFRDGWFHPGDLGTLVGPGQLKLVGRRGDVLNLGGRKVACADLESRLLALPAIQDVAVFQQNDRGGAAPVHVCAVVRGGADLPGLEKSIAPVIGFDFGFFVVSSIPRTTEGKIKRNVLRQALASPPPAGAAPQTAAAKAVVAA